MFWVVLGWLRLVESDLSTESVECTSLAFQSVDDVHSSDGLPLGVLCVGDCITDDILKENFEYTPGLFVDQSRDALDTASSRQTSDSWLGDTLDVITKNFPVSLGATFAQAFTSFSSSRHDYVVSVCDARLILTGPGRPGLYIPPDGSRTTAGTARLAVCERSYI